MGKTIAATRQVRAYNISSKSANYTSTMVNGVEVILCDATGGSFTVTLPDPEGNYAMFSIKKIDSSANTITITPGGGRLIDGGANAVLTTQYEAITIISDSSSAFHIL